MMGTVSRAAEVSSGMIVFSVYGVGSDCQRFRERCCHVLTSLSLDATCVKLRLTRN